MIRPVLDIGDAHWSETPDFDPRDHIHHRSAMGWDQLVGFITDLHETTLDRDRPLWNVHIVRNVVGVSASPTPCTVVVLHFHHSMADGMGVATIARGLFSPDLDALGPDTGPLGTPSTRARVTALNAARLPLRPFLVLADLWNLISVSRRATKDRKAGLWTMPDVEPRLTAVNDPIGPRRESAVIFDSVGRLREVARSHDASVNDVVLSVVGATMAAHLGDPNQPLAASVPISVRDLVGTTMRNALGFGTVALRPDLPFSERVRAVHDQVRAERTRLNLPSFAAMYTALPRLPGAAYRALYRFGQRRASRRSKPDVTQLRVSTIPKGSADGWTLAGARAAACFGVTPICDGLGVNHTVSTLGDNLAIGVLADPDQLERMPAYIDALRTNLAELRPATGQSPRDT